MRGIVRPTGPQALMAGPPNNSMQRTALRVAADAGVRRQQMQRGVTMPVNIRIIHAHDFIKANPEGKLDLEKSKKLLVEIASAAAHLVDYDIILDTRQAQSKMSAVDLWFLAAELSDNFRKAFSRSVKTAVLCPSERFDHAEFFALCAQNRGFQINAFTSFTDAYEWLIADRT
jgi:hypothetical protein